MTVDESLAAFAPVLARAGELGWWRRGYVSTAFGCPYTGRSSPARAVEVALRLLELGVDEVCFGDTIGVGVPAQVAALTALAVEAGMPLDRIAYHFHDTRGTALANVAAGLDAGVRCFDASAGGTGGCPYAPGAAGNLATEDLVYFLDASGWESGRRARGRPRRGSVHRRRSRTAARDQGRSGRRLGPGDRRPHLPMSETRAQRIERGRALRASAPRSSHAAFTPSPGRDPLAILEASNEERVPELIPYRFGRMATSPFAFYRGSAAIMAADLAGTPVTGLRVQACGDAHIGNFGEFATPERRVVFDINDFDETLPGAWEWDVKRLAASIDLVARDRIPDPAARREMVSLVVREYRERIRAFAELSTLDMWHSSISIDDVVAHFPEALSGPGHPSSRPGASQDPRPGGPEADGGRRRPPALRR